MSAPLLQERVTHGSGRVQTDKSRSSLASRLPQPTADATPSAPTAPPVSDLSPEELDAGLDKKLAAALRSVDDKAAVYNHWMLAGEKLVKAAQRQFVAMKLKGKAANGRKTSVGSLGGNGVQITLNEVQMPATRLERASFETFQALL